MSGKSSIHVIAVKSGSERHNEREQELDYVRKDLTPENESFKLMKIAEARANIEQRYRESTGQKMQAKATPIKEGVLLISKEHGIQDLKNLASKLEERFGIKTIQAYTHKDEGHYDIETKEWKPNYHAHMVFDWTDQKTGKNLKLSREDMSEMQTIVADSLGLERGVKSDKKHVNPLAWKAQEIEKDLEKLYNVQNVLPKALKVIQQAKGLQSEIQSLEGSKNALKNEISHNSSILESYKQELALIPKIEENIKALKIEQNTLQSSNNAIKGQLNNSSELLERLRKEIEAKEKQAERIKELEKQQKEIEQKTELARANLNYLEKKTEVARAELQKIEPPKQVQEVTKSQGFKL